MCVVQEMNYNENPANGSRDTDGKVHLSSGEVSLNAERSRRNLQSEHRNLHQT